MWLYFTLMFAVMFAHKCDFCTRTTNIAFIITPYIPLQSLTEYEVKDFNNYMTLFTDNSKQNCHKYSNALHGKLICQ